MAELGIEKASVFNLPPVEFVELAARLGCRHISAGLASFPYGQRYYPEYSLREDRALRRRMIAAMDAAGVSISLAEGFVVRPGVDAVRYDKDLDIVCELGAPRINVVSMDDDLVRSFDQFAALHAMAARRDLETTLEFAPCLAVCDLPIALAAIEHVDDPRFRLLVDTMHLVRSGAGPKDLAALDPALIGYVQVSDALWTPRIEDYFEEAMCERMVPGEGELGLSEVLAALPADRVFGLEVPLRSRMTAGMGPEERLAPCVRAARSLLANLPA
ncbi:sugar phosphate isomerase/epimerase family protein [Nocardia jiangxiensis]|uniref:Sugar phosphate isomerase/epimerase family protein n=1 Tax=Nocardia jiangxiensis TaxID=282685 RepID=A0ABW6RUL0_9NOCA